MAPLLAPIDGACDLSDCDSFELGPALFIFTPVCDDGSAVEFCIPCDQQRSDASLSISQRSTEISNQCSDVKLMRPSGTEVMLEISLGSAICRQEVLAAFFNIAPVASATTEGASYLPIMSRTSRYQHYQVSVIPMDGGQPSTSEAIVLLYAVPMFDGAALNFSPTAAKEMKVKIKAEPHPETGELARWIKNDPVTIGDLALCAA